MARLHENSDDDLPELQDIINQHAQKAWPQSQPPSQRKALSSKITYKTLTRNGCHVKETGRDSSSFAQDLGKCSSKSACLEIKGSKRNHRTQIQSQPFTDRLPVQSHLEAEEPLTRRAAPRRPAKHNVRYDRSPLLDGDENHSSFVNESGDSEEDWHQSDSSGIEICDGAITAERRPLQEQTPYKAEQGSELRGKAKNAVRAYRPKIRHGNSTRTDSEQLLKLSVPICKMKREGLTTTVHHHAHALPANNTFQRVPHHHLFRGHVLHLLKPLLMAVWFLHAKRMSLCQSLLIDQVWIHFGIRTS